MKSFWAETRLAIVIFAILMSSPQSSVLGSKQLTDKQCLDDERGWNGGITDVSRVLGIGRTVSVRCAVLQRWDAEGK
jgi:hypothetical protein